MVDLMILLVYFFALIYMLVFGMGSIIFYLSAHSSNMISMLLKSIPAVIVGILIALLLRDTFCENNVFYRSTGIKYCEVIVTVVVLITGILVNCGNYRVICKRDC